MNDKYLIYGLFCDRTVVMVWSSVKISRKVYLGTPQGGVLSPLLWILVVTDLLKELEKRSCPVTAYADVVVKCYIVYFLMVKEKFLNTVYKLIGGYLNMVPNWANRSDSAVNPSKTEMVLVTSKY